MLISQLKKELKKGYGIVVVKKGIEEKVIGEAKEVEKRGHELVCLCAGVAQIGYLEEGYRILVIVNNGKGFEVFEYTKRHFSGREKLPFEREYRSNFFL